MAKTSWREELEPVTGLEYSCPCLWLISGPPGSSKTTLSCRIAAERSAPVVFLSAEMPIGRALSRLLRISGLGQRQDAVILRQASASMLASYAKDAATLVVDSVPVVSLTANDLRCLCDGGYGLVLVVAQVTKRGDPRGSLSLVHEADIVVEISEDRAWELTKSRFEQTGRVGHAYHRAIPKQPKNEDNLVHLPQPTTVEEDG